LNGALQGSPVSFAAAEYAPATASHIAFDIYINHNGTYGNLGLWVDGDQAAATPAIGIDCDYRGHPSVNLPTPTVPKAFYYQRVTLLNALMFEFTGWTDGFLAGLPSQLQAKYTPDTSQPQMLWRGNSRIDVQASPGQPSTVLLTLQDGKQRSFGPVLTWDPSTGIVDGGLDTGTEASSTWYYLYMVPKSGADDFLHVRGSVSAPPTGPTGYTNWRYIGAVRNDGSSNVLNFEHTGSVFEYATNTQPVPFTGAGSADVSLQTLALVTHIPATAQQAHLGAYVQVNSAGAMYFFVDGLADITTSTTRWNTSHARLGGNAATEVDHLNAMVPTPDATKQVGYFRETAYSECRIDCFGWLDGYLGSAAGLGGGGPIGNTLNGAYNSGGSGAGRAITVNAGAVEMNASGSNALKLDGYLTLQEIATPASMLNKGLVYSADDGGDTELFYRDDKSRSTQVTKDGYLYAQSIQGRFISASVPTDAYGLTWSASGSKWQSGRPTPAPHAASHKSGGYDSVKLDEFAAPTNVTTLNSTVGAHGLLPRLSGSPSDALLGDGTWGALSVYALKTVLDAYAQKTLLDSYMVDTDLTIYAEKGLLDGYIVDPGSSTDGYALAWDGSQWAPRTGGKLNLDWNPETYVPATVPPFANSVDQLTAHLAGIDAYLGALPDGYSGTVTLSEIIGFVIENGLIKSVF
jgi:hypothetical protein